MAGRGGAAASSRKAAPQNSMMRFYSDDASGLKVGPTTVLFMTLIYMFVVLLLHMIVDIEEALNYPFLSQSLEHSASPSLNSKSLRLNTLEAPSEVQSRASGSRSNVTSGHGPTQAARFVSQPNASATSQPLSYLGYMGSGHSASSPHNPQSQCTTGRDQRWGLLGLPPRPTPTVKSRRGGCCFVLFIVAYGTCYGGFRCKACPSVSASELFCASMNSLRCTSDNETVCDFSSIEKASCSILDNISVVGVAYAALFHLAIWLLIVAFYKASSTDPGGIPPNWGFYMGDQVKRRRYCKACNVWKPDRAHHCSACGRCVLNMDHHCPWVKNCIGHQNRKFFVQLIFYSILSLSCVLIHGSIFIYRYANKFAFSAQPLDAIRCGAAVLMVLLAVALVLPMICFCRYHANLVARNSTTIEDLDERNKYKYDLGFWRNCAQGIHLQVMGPNLALWWLPAHTTTSRPQGDGVRWSQNYMRAVHSDETDESL